MSNRKEAPFELRCHRLSGAFQAFPFFDEESAREAYAVSERDSTVLRSALQRYKPNGGFDVLASFNRSF